MLDVDGKSRFWKLNALARLAPYMEHGNNQKAYYYECVFQVTI